MSKWLRILRSPEDEGGSEGGGDGGEQTSGAPPKDAPSPAALDMNSKIKMGDGSEVTVGELMNGYQAHGQVVKERDDLATRMEGVMSLFNDDTTPERRETVTRQILTDAGYGTEEVDAYIDVVGMNSDVEPDEYEDDDVTADDKQTVAPDNGRVQQLEQELELLKKGQHRSRVRELEASLDGNLDRVIDSHPKLKLLFEKTRDLQPGEPGDQATKEAVMRAKAAVKGQLKREALEKMNIRRAQAGTFEDSWMAEEIDKAVEPVLSIYQSVIGDIDRLGRTPETVAGQTGRDVLARDPVPRPDGKAGKDSVSKLKAWTEDSLLRLAHSGTGQSTV